MVEYDSTDKQFYTINDSSGKTDKEQWTSMDALFSERKNTVISIITINK